MNASFCKTIARGTLAGSLVVCAVMACTGRLSDNGAGPGGGLLPGEPGPDGRSAGTPGAGPGGEGGWGTGGIRRLRRLSNREYNNVVRDLLDDSTRPADKFLEDSYSNGYDNGSAGLTVQPEQVSTYQIAAEALAASAVKGGLGRLLGGCDVAKDGEAKCRTAFFASFPRRAFRRPPSPGELANLNKLFDEASKDGGFTNGVQATVEAILQSPQFLYREELGAADASPSAPSSAGGRVRLTSHEVASELSFLLTGSMPDPELFAAADSGRLATPDDVERQAKRLLATPAAHASMREIFNQWLATNRLQGTTKDAKVFPKFSKKLSASMAQEINLFVDQVMWDGTGTLKELFTSNRSFVDGALGALYEVAANGDAFQSVTLEEKARKGILTRAGFLTVHASPEDSAPVARGVFLRQAILCAPLPPPPPDVLARMKTIPVTPGQTTRDRYRQHSADAFCQGCHQFIDGVGFGFEQFDGIGTLRTTENGSTVDTSGNLKGTEDIDGPFVGVSELSTRLATSRQFSSCFVRQMFRYAMGVAETGADDGSLKNLSRDFTTDRSVTALLLAYVRSPLFFERLPEGEKR